MIHQSILLLKNILEENNIAPQKLQESLEIYTTQVNEYLETMNPDQDDVIYLSIKDMNSVVEGFSNLLDYYSKFPEWNK
jgi:hypothetical protein